jgi:hypothetical protein
MSLRTNLQCGICEEEGNDGTVCGGFLQINHKLNIVYCLQCTKFYVGGKENGNVQSGFSMELDKYEEELKKATNEYLYRDVEDNLQDLNFMGRPIL